MCLPHEEVNVAWGREEEWSRGREDPASLPWQGQAIKLGSSCSFRLHEESQHDPCGPPGWQYLVCPKSGLDRSSWWHRQPWSTEYAHTVCAVLQHRRIQKSRRNPAAYLAMVK